MSKDKNEIIDSEGKLLSHHAKKEAERAKNAKKKIGNMSLL